MIGLPIIWRLRTLAFTALALAVFSAIECPHIIDSWQNAMKNRVVLTLIMTRCILTKTGCLWWRHMLIPTAWEWRRSGAIRPSAPHSPLMGRHHRLLSGNQSRLDRCLRNRLNSLLETTHARSLALWRVSYLLPLTKSVTLPLWDLVPPIKIWLVLFARLC